MVLLLTNPPGSIQISSHHIYCLSYPFFAHLPSSDLSIPLALHSHFYLQQRGFGVGWGGGGKEHCAENWFPGLVLDNVRKRSLSLDPPIPFMFESKGICDGPCDSEEEDIVSPGSTVTVAASCLTGENWPGGLLIPAWWEGLLDR